MEIKTLEVLLRAQWHRNSLMSLAQSILGYTLECRRAGWIGLIAGLGIETVIAAVAWMLKSHMHISPTLIIAAFLVSVLATIGMSARELRRLGDVVREQRCVLAALLTEREEDIAIFFATFHSSVIPGSEDIHDDPKLEKFGKTVDEFIVRKAEAIWKQECWLYNAHAFQEILDLLVSSVDPFGLARKTHKPSYMAYVEEAHKRCSGHSTITTAAVPEDVPECKPA